MPTAQAVTDINGEMRWAGIDLNGLQHERSLEPVLEHKIPLTPNRVRKLHKLFECNDMSLLALRAHMDGIGPDTMVLYRKAYRCFRKVHDLVIPGHGQYRAVRGKIYFKKHYKLSEETDRRIQKHHIELTDKK